MDATKISHSARTACVILVVVAAMLPCGEGHVRDKMDKVKEWFDHGSISDVQKAAERDGGKSAGEGVCLRENMGVCVRVCALVSRAFRSKESLCKLSALFDHFKKQAYQSNQQVKSVCVCVCVFYMKRYMNQKLPLCLSLCCNKDGQLLLSLPLFLSLSPTLHLPFPPFSVAIFH